MSAEPPPPSDPTQPPVLIQPDEPDAPAPSRRRRLVKWAIVALVLVVAFVALVPTILSTSVAKDVIHSWLEANVARKVEFSKLDVSWGDGVRLEGLRVSDEAGGAEPFLEAPHVVIDAPLLPLLWKKLRVRKFLIEDPVVRIARTSETETNAHGVMKTKKVRRKDSQDEASVLPEIHVPVEVKNLTLVLADRAGHEARRSGISFTGLLDTREGPTTFDLNVPCGPGAGLRFSGSAALFAPDGTMLGAGERTADVSIVFAHVDAAQNGEFIALVAGDTPVAGVLDGTIDAHVAGTSAKGSVDLRLSRLGYGDATKAAASRAGDDLTMSGRFESGDGKFRVDGWKVRADGLVLDADLSGSFAAIDGHATLDADLARITGTLRAIGVKFPGTVAGRLAGSVKFTPSPSSGTGEFALTGLRVDGLVADRPPVAVESAQIRFAVVPSAERFELTSFDVKLADLSASAHGTRAKDGTLDFAMETKGDLGGLLARVRDLGFLPGGFAVNGDIDAQIKVTGKPDALVVEMPRLVLAEKDARIEASGTRAADGALDFRASGSGDLGSLFGRAAAAGSGPAGLGELKGRFAFEATAKGPASAIAVDVPKLHVEGDIALEAHGKLSADGAIDAQVDDLSGNVDDLLLLARRMALLDRDVSLGGRLSAKATVKGTREKPEIPQMSLKLSGGTVTADVTGSVDAAGALAADATMTADLAALGDVIRRAGFDALKAPLSGSLTMRAKASGTRDKIAVPEFSANVTGGPADVDVTGRWDAAGTVTATANVSGDLDRAIVLARDQGLLKRTATTGCKYTLRASVDGPPKELAVTSAQLGVTGPLRFDVTGSADARRNFTATGKIGGAIQPLLDLAAAWSGEEAKAVEGTIAGSFAAEGRPDRFDLRVPALSVRARGLTVDAEADRAADGTARAKLKAAGPIADAVALARVFGYATEVEAEGTVDADVNATVVGPKVEASAALVATRIVVTKPTVGGGVFRETRLAFDVPSAKYDLDAKTLNVAKSRLQMDGAEIEATAQATGLVVTLDGTVTADERFAKGHPELLGGATFKSVSGPFRFQGDVADGRAKAAEWTGGFDLAAKDIVAPHVTVATATLPGKIADGLVTIDPIAATVNGGPVTGRATIGLVGETPSHRLVLDGKDVGLDADLAPLLARASPLFAMGEEGKTGGKGSLTLDLTASGYDSATIKKTLTGSGTVGLADAYVESSRAWVGEVMKLLGTSERLTLAPVSIPFKVKDSKVSTGELPFEGAGLAMRIGGNAGLDGKLDYLMRVKTTGGSGLLEKFSALLDKDGYLALPLGGTIASPKIKLPDWKDAAKGALEDLLSGRKKKDDPPPPKPPAKKKKPLEVPAPPPGEEPPVPPPPGEEPPPPPEKKDDKSDEPPPPPK